MTKDDRLQSEVSIEAIPIYEHRWPLDCESIFGPVPRVWISKDDMKRLTKSENGVDLNRLLFIYLT